MFFDRPEKGSCALLVHVEIRPRKTINPGELEELAISAGLEPVASVHARLRKAHPRTLIGAGKLQEIKRLIQDSKAVVAVFDHDLSPTQERNLEQELQCRVNGRTGLILDIFADRARTHEGKLQVELAQLRHLSTRLIKGWTHLDRQRGGSGRRTGAAAGLGGAGETQLEADQRMIGKRIAKIGRRLEKVRKQRFQSRRSRSRADIGTATLVGYTNAGKSSLFNRICDCHVHTADELFATLDPTLRKLTLPAGGSVVLADTVGFISDLPHGLIEAFRATLEEVKESHLLLHVVDAQAEDRDWRIAEVNRVLEEIGAEKVPQLLVYNKTDLTGDGKRVNLDSDGVPERVWVSAKTGHGVEDLLHAVSIRIRSGLITTCLTLNVNQGGIRADLYRLGRVGSESVNEDGSCELQITMEEKELRKLLRKAGVVSSADIPRHFAIPDGSIVGK